MPKRKLRAHEIVTPPQKRCRGCGKTWPAACYWATAWSPDGLYCWCRPCCSEYNAERRRRQRVDKGRPSYSR
jgi:hypothetical protein